MNLLLISNNPTRASFKQRFAIYFDIFKDNGINPTLEKLPSSLPARIALFRSASKYDCVILHKKGLNPIDAFFLKKNTKRLIYNYDDAFMFKDSSPQTYSASHYKPFKRSVKASDSVLVGSEYLAKFAIELGVNAKVIPLGLNVREYSASIEKPSDGKIRLVWIGSASTLVYLEQLKEMLELLGDRYDNVVLRIIGDTFFDLKNMEVEKFKWDFKKRAQYLCSCDIGLAPLPDDNFTQGKCSFKVLEYGASKLPVIASPVGTNIEHVVEGETGYLVSSMEQWKEKLCTLIDNQQERVKMGLNGYQRAQEHSIEKIGLRLCDYIKAQALL